MADDADVDEEAFEFFNGLSGHLNVELTEPPERISESLLNMKALPTARIRKVVLNLEVPEEDDNRPLTEEEWNLVVLHARSIRMRGEDGQKVVEHVAPDGSRFTVRDLAAAIAETELRSRGDTEWFGGIDVHHVFFEGIFLEEDGIWSIAWGS